MDKDMKLQALCRFPFVSNNLYMIKGLDFISRQTININSILVGNEIINHSDVVGAAPTTTSFST